MKVSEKGVAFIAAHEGFVARTYLDAAGVKTIGYGFTMRSRVFSGWFKAKHGRAMQMGDTMTRAEASAVLGKLLDEEYAQSVRKSLPSLVQHQFDACTSVVYNLGPRALKWKWAQALMSAKPNASLAALRLRSTGVTAGGRKLKGLERRRADEANLLENGVYAFHGVPAEGVQRTEQPEPANRPDPVVKEAQELLTARGFNPGAIDGWMGRKTKAALVEYQKAHPHLTADGILGPATLAQLRRDAAAAKEAIAKGGGSVIGSGGLAWVSGLPWQWIAAGVAVVAVGAAVYFGWRYRDVIARRVNSLLGREVP